MEPEKEPLCLCFPCILYYLGKYEFPESESQFYPVLQQKGFTVEDQKAIAEEWYWVAIERETAVKNYLNGCVTFTDGCYWRPPPPRNPRQSTPLTPASSSMSGPST